MLAAIAMVLVGAEWDSHMHTTTIRVCVLCVEYFHVWLHGALSVRFFPYSLRMHAYIHERERKAVKKLLLDQPILLDQPTLAGGVARRSEQI